MVGDGSNGGRSLQGWINTTLMTVCGSLLGILWFMLQGQIASLGSQIGDLRIDIRVLQTQTIEQKAALKGLEERVQGLVDAINGPRKKRGQQGLGDGQQ